MICNVAISPSCYFALGVYVVFVLSGVIWIHAWFEGEREKEVRMEEGVVFKYKKKSNLK